MKELRLCIKKPVLHHSTIWLPDARPSSFWYPLRTGTSDTLQSDLQYEEEMFDEFVTKHMLPAAIATLQSNEEFAANG